MGIRRFFIACFTCLLGFVAEASSAEPGHVLVDAENPAYTVFLALPEELPKLDLMDMQLEAMQRKGVEVVAWKAFTENLDKQVCARIVRNEYPEVNVAEDIVELLVAYPQTPVGLTWNGGIAITYGDYEHALETYRRHLADPGARMRPERIEADPVHPMNHTVPLLGH